MKLCMVNDPIIMGSKYVEVKSIKSAKASCSGPGNLKEVLLEQTRALQIFLVFAFLLLF